MPDDKPKPDFSNVRSGGSSTAPAAPPAASPAPAVTEFHIAKPDGWPVGKYQVVLSANGQPTGTLQFTVSD